MTVSSINRRAPRSAVVAIAVRQRRSGRARAEHARVEFRRAPVGDRLQTLIASQCAMELYTCVFGVCTTTLTLTHGYRYGGNAVLDG